MVVATAAWAGLVAVSTAMYGKGETLRERLVSMYRQLLQRLSFLWLSDVVLLLACAFLIYDLLAFRQIEIYSEQDTVVTLNDAPGDLHELGVLKGKTPQKFRLELGNRHLVFSDPTTRDPQYSTIVGVQPLWKSWDIDRVSTPKASKGKYEKTP